MCAALSRKSLLARTHASSLPIVWRIASQNIDTDQIIPAEYLTLVPSKVGERSSGLALRCVAAFCRASAPLHFAVKHG